MEGPPSTFCATESRAAHGELGKGMQGLIGTWSIRDPVGASGGTRPFLPFGLAQTLGYLVPSSGERAGKVPWVIRAFKEGSLMWGHLGLWPLIWAQVMIQVKPCTGHQAQRGV